MFISQLKPLNQAIQQLFIIGVMGLGQVTTIQMVQANTVSTQYYQISAGSLDAALIQFASQAGVELSFEPESIKSLKTNGLKGNYSVSDGFNTLLAPHQLQAQQTATGYKLIAQTKAQARDMGQLKPIDVTTSSSANRDSNAVQLPVLVVKAEDENSYTVKSTSTATKLNLSLRETPQTVTIITRQRIEDQSMNTLGDALKYTPGVTVTKRGGERERLNSRGFQISNLMVDGLPISYETDYMSTGLLSMYDRVEVVRGVSGLTEGVGAPGGSINLVRKRPTQEFQASITAAAGSWDNYRTELDVSGPLTSQGSLRGRAVISYLDKNSFIDDNENKRSLVYGILESDIGENTLLTLGASWSQDNNPGADWNGWGTYLDGRFLPISRSTRMSPSWSYWDKESTTLFAELEHRLSENWTSKISATHIQSDSDILGTYLGFSTDHNPYFSLSGAGQAYRYSQEQYSLDGMLSGNFSLLGNTHDLILGASYRQVNSNDRGAKTDFSEVIFDPTNWDPSSVPKPSIISDWNAWYQNTTTEQFGAYVTTRFTLSDQLKLILGGRLDWYEYEMDHFYSANNASYKATHEFTPYMGLVYQLNDSYSAYASATRIFNPQNYQTPSGSLLDPQQGSNYEIGLKGEYLGGRLNASLAVFQLDLENLPVSLPSGSCVAGQVSCYAPSGKVRSRGVDIEMNGNLTANWQIGAGYTYNHVKVLEESDYSQSGTGLSGSRWGSNLPLNLFKVFTSYRLPGTLQKWKIGGGLHTQSKTYNNISAGQIRQGGYFTNDLFISYTASKNLEITGNANNIFDKKYYSAIGTARGTNFFGDPRNYMLTIKYKF